MEQPTIIRKATAASGTEFFGPFVADLLKTVRVRDSFGRFDAGRMPLLPPGRVSVTRVRPADAPEYFTAMNRSGVTVDIPADRAAEFLASRRVDGQLVSPEGDAAHEAAVAANNHRMGY